MTSIASFCFKTYINLYFIEIPFNVKSLETSSYHNNLSKFLITHLYTNAASLCNFKSLDILDNPRYLQVYEF